MIEVRPFQLNKRQNNPIFQIVLIPFGNGNIDIIYLF